MTTSLEIWWRRCAMRIRLGTLRWCRTALWVPKGLSNAETGWNWCNHETRITCEGEIWLRIRRSLGWSRWFTDKRLQAKIHDTWIFNLQNSHTGRKFLNLGEFGDLMLPILRHVLRKHIRFFSDYQVGDRVDARSETGVPQLLFKTHCSHLQPFFDVSVIDLSLRGETFADCLMTCRILAFSPSCTCRAHLGDASSCCFRSPFRWCLGPGKSKTESHQSLCVVWKHTSVV